MISLSTLRSIAILFTMIISETSNITRLDNVPSNLRYIKIVFNNVMSNKKIIFASMLAAILATGLLVLNPSMKGIAQAQMYDSQYGYDNSYNNYYPEPKSSHTDIQKISCVNSNTNVNGIDIQEIPRDAPGAAAANEGGPDVANTQDGNGIGDRINFDRNLVNICVNLNFNNQDRSPVP